MFPGLFLAPLLTFARPVTYGSYIQLANKGTNARLYSFPNILWPSGGQVVTAVPPGLTANIEDSSKLWIVRGLSSQHALLEGKDIQNFLTESDLTNVTEVFKVKSSGEPVRCGDVVRLEHADSGKMLCTQHQHSIVTKDPNTLLVVTADVQGSPSDRFKVECSDATWEELGSVQLHHIITKKPLITSAQAQFNHKNCQGCPMQRHTEVTLAPGKQNLWTAKSIMHVSQQDWVEDESEEPRDEL